MIEDREDPEAPAEGSAGMNVDQTLAEMCAATGIAAERMLQLEEGETPTNEEAAAITHAFLATVTPPE